MLDMKYFVLKPEGNDPYAAASRDTMLAYADYIKDTDIELHDELYEWVEREEEKLEDCEVEVEIPDDYFIHLAKQAHEKDVTFNEHVNDILKEKMVDVEKKLCKMIDPEDFIIEWNG